MPKVDLAAAFNAQIRRIPGGEKYVTHLEVDPGAAALALAEAWAADMAENLTAGKRPDGKGPMPARRTPHTVGRRGEGTDTAASIHVTWSSARNRLAIVADETERDALRRILRGIPFRPPATSERIRAVLENAGAIAAPLLAGLQATAATRRSATWSPKRLAAWKAWKA